MVSLLYSSALVVLGALGCIAAVVEVSPDSQFVTSKSDLSIPSTGFVTANDGNNKMLFRIMKKNNKMATCDRIQVINVPEDISSPLVGSNIFSVGDVYNKHFSWFNGVEYISYIDSGSHGTWILGVEPGVDNGYVFLKPESSSMVPVGLETSDVTWYWNLHGEWTSMQDVKIICLDESQISVGYFDVEYWNYDTNSMQNALLLSEGTNFILWTPETGSRKMVTNVEELLELGKAVKVAPTESNEFHIARLVNCEHNEDGWRVTMRFDNENNSTKRETLVSLGGNGRIIDYQIKQLTNADSLLQLRINADRLSSVRVGDYIWMWASESNFFLKPNARSSPPSLIPDTFSVKEILIHCVYASRGTWSFTFDHDDRRKAMAHTVLSMHTDLYTFTLDQSGNVINVDFDPTNEDFTTEMRMTGFVVIGRDPIQYLRKYIVENEGVLSKDVSSCYLYHAAVSIPQQFIYALEVVCVLMGAKPLTMIQYTSDSDAQWKFPLMRELSQAIVLARRAIGPSCEIDYRVYTYKNFETLVIFRRSRKYVADNLLPRYSAQALHPMPFPDTRTLEKDNIEQIYNAAWNGLLLGYPPRFVQSYCEDFHNELSKSMKRSTYARAKKDISRYMANINESVSTIALGLDPVVNDDIWSFVRLQFE